LSWSAYLPFTDLRGYHRGQLRGDVIAALTVMFMGVPQGVAYAMIAGLPPAMGLYATTIPAIVGAPFRSSRHVLTGPTNAVSLLVGGALSVELGADPAVVAVTLAVMVGVLQLGAGLLGLGNIVDFISSPVVLGYISGAGILIAIGQLPNLTATPGARGHVVHRIDVWLQGVADASAVSILMGLGTAAFIVGLRLVNRRLPGPILAMGLATAISYTFSLPQYGLQRIRDLHPVPVGLPPVTMPDLDLVSTLVPIAVAVAVLSLVEASAVGRAIAAKTGQRLHSGAEFVGQGLGNLAAGFFGGYPVSGSLSRSALNERAGASSRLAGVYSGVFMLAVLLVLGPVVNETPIAALAGLLFVVAYDLVDRVRIATILRSTWADRLTFVATVLGTWALPLDKAIYLGVGISLVFLLRQTRMLTVRYLEVDAQGGLQEVGPLSDEPYVPQDPAVKILQIEGRLFFGVEGDLRRLLDDAAADPAVRAIVLRLRRTQGMDVTVARVFEEAARGLQLQGRTLILADVPKETLDLMLRLGLVDILGAAQVFAETPRWFESLGQAVRHAQTLVQLRSTPSSADTP